MIVELHNATLTNGGRRLLSDLSLMVRPGCRLAVTGGTAVERSSFLQVVLGMRSLDSGWVCFDGEPMPVRSAAYFRRHISYMPRWFDFGDASVADIERFLQRGADKRAASEAGNALCKCLDSLGVPRESVSVSLSEMDSCVAQRAVMALTFMNRRPIALLDSPTRFQDVQHSKIVADFLSSEWFCGSAMIVSTQDPALLSVCDGVVDLGSAVQQ